MLKQRLDLELEEAEGLLAVIVVVDHILRHCQGEVLTEITELRFRLGDAVRAFNVPTVALDRLRDGLYIVCIEDDDSGTHQILNLLKRV